MKIQADFIVRSNRGVSLAIGLMFSLAIPLFIYLAVDDEYHCGRRGAWLCALASQFEDWKIFGLNPVFLVLVVLPIVLVQICLRQAWYGVSFKMTGEKISGPSVFGTKTIELGEILDVESQPKLFGGLVVVKIKLKNGRTTGFGSANPDDAAEFLRRLSPNHPAAPAIPPAT